MWFTHHLVNYNLSDNVVFSGGVDYDSATLTAVFTADSTFTTVEIPIINDTAMEENEEFSITLNLLPTNSTRVTLGVQSTATAVIIDTSMLIILLSWSVKQLAMYATSNAIDTAHDTMWCLA